jgi:hypothetical protein
MVGRCSFVAGILLEVRRINPLKIGGSAAWPTPPNKKSPAGTLYETCRILATEFQDWPPSLPAVSIDPSRLRLRFQLDPPTSMRILTAVHLHPMRGLPRDVPRAAFVHPANRD